MEAAEGVAEGRGRDLVDFDGRSVSGVMYRRPSVPPYHRLLLPPLPSLRADEATEEQRDGSGDADQYLLHTLSPSMLYSRCPGERGERRGKEKR